MTYVKITDKDGKPIDNSNPLPVVTDIQIGAVTATDVTIKDPVTPTNKLAVNANGSINVQLTGSNAIKCAVQTVTTAGTRVQLPNYACREVTIIALRTNTGRIYVGGSDVSSTVYGADLGPQDSITLPVSNTNLIYIDASVSGEGISYVAIS